MNTSDVITAYLTPRALRQFARETGNRPLHEVPPPAVIAFLRGHGALSASRTTKFRLLKGFYLCDVPRLYVAGASGRSRRFLHLRPVTDAFQS